ncbi:LysM peptidoglycan-binding domain-containing protein [Cellulomonas palmilytica]|uniref:LysM peptidoglycan-binding domain-containing protein n=1 Tax=Cellulomonas palmilytica TaxID=2608402 RepID=UPI001F456995|nr:LysM peptidoglycan-binding domain-containing protein [Cellulomonas palmilytica]UJP39206.1 LysM peptidoglycan-binding domain-containing protein [Cellulomonas palmilytica]
MASSTAAARREQDRSERAGRRRTARRAASGTGATLALVAISVSTSGAAHADDSYTVRDGDTVSHIATRTGSSIAAITRANALADPSRIRAGQVLTIPSATSRSTARTPSAPPQAARHVVRAGETVSGIAARTGTTVRAIIAANHLRADGLIIEGQTLTIPGTGSGAAPRARTSTPSSTYTVRAGDTVSAIAARFGTSVSAVVSANGLGPNAMIRIGQTLRVGGTASSSPAPTTGRPLVGSTFEGRTYARDVVDAANANKRALLAAGVPSKAQMQAKVAATARAYGLDPALAQAIAFQESGFNHTAVSPANAIGTMQVIPSSGDWASSIVGRQLNLLDPDDNVTAGVVILRALVRMSPDLPSAIAGYYQGAASVRKYGMFSDTRRYAANVQTLMARFR